MKISKNTQKIRTYQVLSDYFLSYKKALSQCYAIIANISIYIKSLEKTYES
jgi:hypothetical protein